MENRNHMIYLTKEAEAVLKVMRENNPKLSLSKIIQEALLKQ